MFNFDLFLVFHHFHWDVIYTLESIPYIFMLIKWIVLACVVLVLYLLLCTPAIDLLRCSGGTVFFRGFRDSIVLVLLAVLQNLINVPVLIRGGIFLVTLRNNVHRFNTSATDNIHSSFMCNTCIGDFFCPGQLRS